MLDLQRHSQCPIWESASTSKIVTNSTKNGAALDEKNHGEAIPWPGLEYACLKIFQTYCKIFNQEEIYDLIVRYGRTFCVLY